MRRRPARRGAALPILATVLATGAAAPAGAEGASDCIRNLVCLEVEWNTDQAVFWAHNRMRVPAGVQVRFERLAGVTVVPRQRTRGVSEHVVPPGAAEQVLMLVRTDMRQQAAAPFHWRISYGDPHARPDPSVEYRMPFGGGERRPLTQGANGRFTHKGRSAWSFDFGMPVGTPVVAARAGQVVEITDGYTRSGISADFLDKANAVTVLHEDGTFASYAHLDPGAGVREGMRVEVGDVLGFSGNTGFSTGPHLHFSVWKGGWDGGATVPIRFAGTPDGRLAEGRLYPPTSRARPAAPASPGGDADGACRCRNGAVITTRLPCRAVCP
jgi:Peptidase family M23